MKLLVSILSFSFVVTLILAINSLIKKEKNIDKFSANFQSGGMEEETKSKINTNKRGDSTLIIIFSLLGSVGGFVVLFIVTGLFTASLIGLLLGFLIPKIMGDSYIKKQNALLMMQLEQSAEIMASVLRSGSGIVEALTRAAKEVKNPLRDELVATANEIRMGIPNSVAFENFANRLSNDELRLLSMAISMQQEGLAVNLGTLLNQIQESIRYKVAFQRDVNVITAENRMAGFIVSVLPFATLAITRLMMPDIIAPLFNTGIGLFIFGTCVFVIVIGVFWMLKIARIKV